MQQGWSMQSLSRNGNIHVSLISHCSFNSSVIEIIAADIKIYKVTDYKLFKPEDTYSVK
jgi:hypothetical protein